MVDLPFDIPKSLASYAEHFESDPIKATIRLKEQLKKRGPDAVGHFLLAWFYHQKNMTDEAVDHALKAKIYAPGSTFLGNLHYYLSHPQTFNAWKPGPASRRNESSTEPPRLPGPVLDLDALIEKLSKVESRRIVASQANETSNQSYSESAVSVDDIASETLASIHETQGKTEAAIQTYKRLEKMNSEKKDYYKQQISRLKSLRDQQADDSAEE
jgi:hypothetical protein